MLNVKEVCPSETICEAHWQKGIQASKGNPPQPTHNGESWSDGWRHKNMLLQKYFDLDTGRQLFYSQDFCLITLLLVPAIISHIIFLVS